MRFRGEMTGRRVWRLEVSGRRWNVCGRGAGANFRFDREHSFYKQCNQFDPGKYCSLLGNVDVSKDDESRFLNANAMTRCSTMLSWPSRAP